VRIDRREGGREADFETARPDVRKDWMEDRRAAGVAEALRQLREGYEIVRP
jgi:NifB/MoaA-like Fe-S oxidoreductase